MPQGHEQSPTIISIRAEEQQRELIDQAAKQLGRTREEFMLDTSCREAQDVLLDQTFFLLDEQAFSEFQALVDNPPPPSEKLIKFLQTKARWE
jgi:uncharacterized protein (DUF1778 family)